MSAPFVRRDLAEMMGSWPLSVTPSFTNPVLMPNSLLTQATILGIRREPSAGFNVGGKSMYVWHDVAGVPTQSQVLFPGGGPYTLTQVIGYINGTAGISPDVVAYDNNKFLMLKSPTYGADSYLRLETSLSPEVFQELGLFAETVSRGGDVQQAQHIDPSRQIANPGQVAMQFGESFGANVVNRVALQLGVNVERDTGLLDDRRLAVRTEESFVYAGTIQLNTGNPDQGVFTGKVSTPTYDQLRDVVVVLDADGNEFTKEVQYVLNGPTPGATAEIQQTPWPNPVDNGRQRVIAPSSIFSAGDVDDAVYVVLTGINLGFGDELEGVPLKVIEYVAGDEVIVQNTDPVTGLPVDLTASSGTPTISRVRMYTARAEVEGLYQNAGLTVRVENQQLALTASFGVSRVERGNRVVTAGVGSTYTIDAHPGDLVVWTGSGSTTPFTNNGTYKVKRVVDDETLELMGEDEGPVYLNADSSLGLGSIILRSDGNFWRTPYVKFAQPTAPNLAAGRGAVPGTGDTVRFGYLVQSSVRDATSDVALHAGSMRHYGDATAKLQRALMRLAGPSVTSFEEILYGQNWSSVEKNEFRLDKEHHDYGRHSNLRPDTIDMYPGTLGPTVTVSTNVSLESVDDPKIRIIDRVNNKVRFGVNLAGMIGIADDVSAFPVWDALDFGGADQRADIFVDHATPYATALFKGSKSKLALQSTTPTPPSISTDSEGVAALRFYFNGGLVVPHVFNTSLKSESTAGKAFLSLGDVENNGAAAAFINNLIVGSDGNVGVGFSTHVYAASPTFKPAAPLHIVARSGGVTELLRLEGHPGTAGGTTVAMTFKPKLADSYYAFLEVDEDSSDWYMNLVTTPVMDSASVGSVAESTFRMVAGATRELFRANKKGIELGRDMRDTAANAVVPRLRMQLADSIVGRTGLTYVSPFDQLGKGGLFGSATDEGDFSWIFGGTVDSAGQYVRDGVGTNQQTVEFLYERTNANSSKWVGRTRRGSATSPWAVGDWQTALELKTDNVYFIPPFGPMTGGSQLRLRNGRIELFSPHNGFSGSNPDYDDGVTANTLVAKSIVKAWARIRIDAGVATIEDGVNISVAQALGAGEKRFVVRMVVGLSDIMQGTAQCFVNTVAVSGVSDSSNNMWGDTSPVLGQIYAVPSNYNAANDSFILAYVTKAHSSSSNVAQVWDDVGLNVTFTIVIYGAQA